MILKVIFLIVCWVIILFIKKGRFAEFISDLRSHQTNPNGKYGRHYSIKALGFL